MSRRRGAYVSKSGLVSRYALVATLWVPLGPHPHFGTIRAASTLHRHLPTFAEVPVSICPLSLPPAGACALPRRWLLQDSLHAPQRAL